jgi:hypothetical protein
MGGSDLGTSGRFATCRMTFATSESGFQGSDGPISVVPRHFCRRITRILAFSACLFFLKWRPFLNGKTNHNMKPAVEKEIAGWLKQTIYVCRRLHS